MGLRINTNIASQEVQRNLRVSNASQEAEFSKLSSGKRITKSADDAAGLAIAKKLEAETKGLRMATRNANDAISLVQVAEGGLNETSSILTRLRELSIQAGSDTVGEAERGYLSLEYEQLVQEADRISKTTSFNGRPLLQGEGEMLSFQVGAYGGQENMIELDSARRMHLRKVWVFQVPTSATNLMRLITLKKLMLPSTRSVHSEQILDRFNLD